MSLVWALRGYSLTPILIFSLCFMFAVDDVISQLPVPTAVPITIDSCPPGTMSQNKLFHKFLLSMVLYHNNSKVTKVKTWSGMVGAFYPCLLSQCQLHLLLCPFNTNIDFPSTHIVYLFPRDFFQFSLIS